MNNYDFEQHVGQSAKGGYERIDISSNVPSKRFILMLFHVPQKVTRMPSILLQRFLQMIFSHNLNVLELKCKLYHFPENMTLMKQQKKYIKHTHTKIPRKTSTLKKVNFTRPPAW